MNKNEANHSPKHHHKNDSSDIALRFLRWFCPASLYESIEGDLLEQFDKDVIEVGARKAQRRFSWNTLKFFRPAILLRNNFTFQLTSTVMIGNYFKVAVRNIQKRKLYSFINVFGLSVGIAFCILIYLFILDEQSFDQFHINKDRLYRIQGTQFRKNNSESTLIYMPSGLVHALREEAPEVKRATRFKKNKDIVSYHDILFNEELVYVDADFFHMFSFPLVSGDSDKLFIKPDEVVLTQSVAGKYFGRADFLGESLTIGKKLYTVSGVVKDPPPNSSLQFSILLPIEDDNAMVSDQLMSLITPTFVELHPKASEESFQLNLEKITQKYMNANLKWWRDIEKVSDDFKIYESGFTKITDIHLQHEVEWDKVSNPLYAWILVGIATFIIIISCINYISMALTSSASRKTEVGIRKVVGAAQKQLVYQFGIESVILAYISMMIGVVLVILFLPAFNEFTDKTITLRDIDFLRTFSLIIVGTLVIGIMAGCYPALQISRFPAQMLKGFYSSKLSSSFSQPILILQFALSSFLLTSSVIMYRQMQFISNKDLGYNQHHIIVIPIQHSRGSNETQIIERFRQHTSTNSRVISVAGTNNPFGGMSESYGWGGSSKEFYGYFVDAHYVKTLGMKIVEGRDFMSTDSSTVIIVNNAFVKEMGWKNPVGEYAPFLNANVIGVVNDFHFLSLENKIEPLFLAVDKIRPDQILVKISSNDIPSTVAELHKVFTEVAPGKPFEYSFLDETVRLQYSSHERWSRVIGFATLFAILTSGLGLFGLAGINAVNRTKEIGIRKVMGAEISSIFIMMNKQYIRLSLVAFVIAVPASWYVMTKWWLADFKFAIEVGWELFAVSMISGLLIALLTVSYHSIKAALINPADTLKYE